MRSVSSHPQQGRLQGVPPSTQTMAILLVIVAVTTMVFNAVYLIPYLPAIPVHENHHFFSEEGHMITPQAAASPKKNTTANNNNKDEGSVSDWIRQEAGIEVTPEMEANLPSWSQIRAVVGDTPVILGLESCSVFRDKVPPLERMLGPAGMFNTGTNLVSRLLKQNCEIPERREHYGENQAKEKYGMRWQVPWGKHTPAKFRDQHSTAKATEINKKYVLPVVSIRHPYSWFGSMCKNSYAAKWDHRWTPKDGDGKNTACPRLRQGFAKTSPWNPVSLKYGENREDHHLSLAHLWNDWYSYYLGGNFPFVILRMEDLVFYPQETTRQVCECAGGKILNDRPFKLIIDSAKADSPGHDKSTGIYEAWVKYSRPNTKETYGFADVDFENARTALDGELMESLGYQHPA